MRTNATVLTAQTIEEATATLQKKKLQKPLLYVYVVDDNFHLKGVLPLRQLLTVDPSTKVEDVMKRSIITMRENDTLGTAINTLEAERLLALPVVDSSGYFLGIIDLELYIEHSIDIASATQKVNVFQMIGYHMMQRRLPSLWQNYRQRMPWIVGNIIGGLFCALISQLYSSVLSSMIMLAFFIPLVLTLSESISTQSLAETLHLLEMKQGKKNVLIRGLIRESKVLLLLGVSSSLVTAAIAFAFSFASVLGFDILVPLIIALSITVSVFCSGIIGTLIPFIFHKMDKDSKVAGGPLTLMFADVVSTFIYLSMGYLFLFN